MFKALWKWLINIGFFMDTSHTPLWNSFYLEQKISKYLLDLFRAWLSIKTCLDVKCSLEILCQTVPVLLMTQVRNVFLQLGYKEAFNPEKKKKYCFATHMMLFILSMRKDVFVGVLVIALISFSKDMFSALSVCLSVSA